MTCNRIIKNGYCHTCGKSEDRANEICFYNDNFWFPDKKTKKRYQVEGEWVNITPKRRLLIFKRDGNKCLSCGTYNNLSIDHIIPKSLGGKNNHDNLQTLCIKCNRKKGNRIRNYREIIISGEKEHGKTLIKLRRHQTSQSNELL